MGSRTDLTVDAVSLLVGLRLEEETYGTTASHRLHDSWGNAIPELGARRLITTRIKGGERIGRLTVSGRNVADAAIAAARKASR